MPSFDYLSQPDRKPRAKSPMVWPRDANFRNEDGTNAEWFQKMLDQSAEEKRARIYGPRPKPAKAPGEPRAMGPLMYVLMILIGSGYLFAIGWICHWFFVSAGR